MRTLRLVEGLNVVVVGGASGLGVATARLLLERGAASVAIIDNNRELLERVVDELRSDGAAVIGVAGDISRADSAHAAFGEAASALVRVHSLVNCAAIYPR